MNKVQVTLTQYHPITREIETDHTLIVDTDDYDNLSLLSFFQDNLVEFRNDAAKKIAASMIDYDSFESDSEYLDRIDRLSDTMYLTEVSVPDAVQRPYSMEGIYPKHGGMWGDIVMGSCMQEAEFNAIWTMAENDGFSLRGRVADGTKPTEAIESLLLYMDSQDLTMNCGPARPTVEDATRIIEQFVSVASSVKQGESFDSVLDAAKDFIGRLKAPLTDRIETVEPDADDSVAGLKL